MSKSNLDQAIEGIDRHLPYLHKERWAIEAAKIRRDIRSSTGPDKQAAQQALQDHYDTLSHPETSRAPLVQQAMENEAARHRA